MVREFVGWKTWYAAVMLNGGFLGKWEEEHKMDPEDMQNVIEEIQFDLANIARHLERAGIMLADEDDEDDEEDEGADDDVTVADMMNSNADLIQLVGRDLDRGYGHLRGIYKTRAKYMTADASTKMREAITKLGAGLGLLKKAVELARHVQGESR